jgi:NADH-quinone oxidoreductase subunit E
MATTDLGPVLSTFERRPESLISLLQVVQDHLGYLPPEAMGTVARHARVPRSRVYGVASFYSQFRFNPVGRKRVAVCRGTACHVGGARFILEQLEPCLTVNDEVSAKLTPKKVRKQFKKARK